MHTPPFRPHADLEGGATFPVVHPIRTLALLAALPACGSRTALDVGQPRDASPAVDSPAPRPDAAADAADAPAPLPDATADVEPTPDAATQCPDGGSPVAYLIDGSGTFFTFDPVGPTTTLVGRPSCPDAAPVWDFTISREGTAYVTYEDWRIFQVDLRTLTCAPTPYRSGQLGVTAFTATVVPTAAGEAMLYYANPGPAGAPVLARSDLTSFALTEIGPVVPELGAGNATYDIRGDALGHLYGLSSGGVFLDLDPSTAALLSATPTTFRGSSWALLTYEQQVFFFGGASVYSYDLAARTASFLRDLPVSAVGASAAPCLPAR